MRVGGPPTDAGAGAGAASAVPVVRASLRGRVLPCYWRGRKCQILHTARNMTRLQARVLLLVEKFGCFTAGLRRLCAFLYLERIEELGLNGRNPLVDA